MKRNLSIQFVVVVAALSFAGGMKGIVTITGNLITGNCSMVTGDPHYPLSGNSEYPGLPSGPTGQCVTNCPYLGGPNGNNTANPGGTWWPNACDACPTGLVLNNNGWCDISLAGTNTSACGGTGNPACPSPCALGHYPAASGTSCVTCPSSLPAGVQSCTINGLTCNTGYTGAACTLCTTNCTACATGYYLSGTSCLLCPSSLPVGVKSCTTSGLTCNTGYTGAACTPCTTNCTVCASGYYPTGTSCTLCPNPLPASIKSCTTTGLTCNPGYTLSGRMCVSKS